MGSSKEMRTEQYAILWYHISISHLYSLLDFP